MKVFIMLMCLATACHCQIRNRPTDTRTLLLSDQELRFAGYALQTVFSSNPNAYVSSSSTITSIQKRVFYFFITLCLSLLSSIREVEKEIDDSAAHLRSLKKVVEVWTFE